jgi:glycosyltransferase involved in cell wall biosynthesis
MVRKEGIRVEVVIAGEGPLLDSLHQLARDLGVAETIAFPGRLTPVEVADQLRSSLVYASTPETEGVSASLLEALACGCVPVVSNLPGNREWVRDGIDGVLVPVGGAGEVASALATIWEGREEWSRRGAANAERARAGACRLQNTRAFVDAYRGLVRRHRMGRVS